MKNWRSGDEITKIKIKNQIKIIFKSEDSDLHTWKQNKPLDVCLLKQRSMTCHMQHEEI